MATMVSKSHLPESPSSEPHDHRPHNHPASHHSKAPSSVQEQHEQNAPLFLGFNQDHSRFACGTLAGFRVYECEPFKEAYRRESSYGGIGSVELLFRSNILAIVGGGPNPKYPPNKLMIWDNNEGRCIGELSFRSQVRAVKLRRDRIVAVLEHKVFVYNFADLKLLLQIETVANPRGLCALSSTSNSSILACPGIQKGQVRVEHYGSKKTKFIAAHDSRLACLGLALDGLLLATASSKGTLIRVFNTVDGTLLQELRRGADRAEIYSIAFAANTHWLAVSSDKGTIHVFSLKVPMNGEEERIANGAQSILATANQSTSGVNSSLTAASTNPGSTLSFMKVVLPRYFSSEWSFSQFRLPEEMKSTVAFGPEKHTIMIVGSDGSFYKCSFDPVHGGEMAQREYFKFIKPEDLISS